jgi:IS5 family transposase
VLRLTAGNVADVTIPEPLLDAVSRVRCLIADKGYDANMLRTRLKVESAQVVSSGTLEPQAQDRL